MPPFLIYEGPLREEDMAKIAGNEARKRDALLNSLPRQGVYKITFPNGHYYIDAATNIPEKLKKILRQLFPSSRTKISRRNSYVDNVPKWIKKCLEENNLKGIESLEVEILEGSLAENISAATSAECYNLMS